MRTRPVEQGAVLRRTRAENNDEDTIPKPDGLGRAREASGAGCPAFVQEWSSFCPSFVQPA